MKVCYWGTFERHYPRNSVLISGLRQNGVEVIERHFSLWRDGFRYNKLALASRLSGKLTILGRALVGYPNLIARYLVLGRHDAVVVGYLGHLDVLFLALFAKARKKPIIFDAFFSLYETAVSDWGVVPKRSLEAQLCLLLDRLACRLADLVLVDTQAHKEFFCKEFGLADAKVRWLYVGADDSIFRPLPRSRGSDFFRVLYVGNYVPLHGVPVILEAAQLLHRENMKFLFIGDNYRSSNGMSGLLRNPDYGRTAFYDWTPPVELRAKIAEADVCLGIFGTSEKAKRVIPGKAFLALAMGKPLVTGDSPAARELFEDGKTAILCEMGNPQALADALLRLKRDALLRQRIAEKGLRLFRDRCSPRVLGSQFVSLIQETIAQRSGAKTENPGQP